mmetsp:Transcript_11781/g.54826  ORF Transcript_11781/g.54826 Transcript_11781/m.54826 type:complete len:201 (-) Transcript_11781:750-1352(-)
MRRGDDPLAQQDLQRTHAVLAVEDVRSGFRRAEEERFFSLFPPHRCGALGQGDHSREGEDEFLSLLRRDDLRPLGSKRPLLVVDAHLVLGHEVRRGHCVDFLVAEVSEHRAVEGMLDDRRGRREFSLRVHERSLEPAGLGLRRIELGNLALHGRQQRGSFILHGFAQGFKLRLGSRRDVGDGFIFDVDDAHREVLLAPHR